MKKIQVSFTLICLAALLFLSACSKKTGDLSPFSSVNLFPGVTLTVDAESISPSGAEFYFYNSTETDLEFTSLFYIEIYENDNWYSLKEKDTVVWDSSAQILYGLSENTLQVTWDFLYGKLSPGKYRIVKLVSDYAVAGEFSIE